jgi:taurine dioxygenase
MTAPAAAVAVPSLSLRPLSAAVGAEVLGLDLSQPLDDAIIDGIRAALDQYGVVLFRRQHLEPEMQLTVSRRFGALQEVAQKQYQMPGQPEIYIIGNVTDETGRAVGDPSVGRLWHSDQSFLQHPAFGSLLYGVECPAEGADTLFANMYDAYDALPAGTRQRIEHLRAEHSFAEYYQELRKRDATQPALTESRRALYPDVLHPLVRRNPRTGRRALYVNPGYVTRIVDLPAQEGDALLAQLYDHAHCDRFVHAHRWQPGDVLFWDNLAVNHKGTPFDTGRYVRRMHRTTIAGSAEAYRATLLAA